MTEEERGGDLFCSRIIGCGFKPFIEVIHRDHYVLESSHGNWERSNEADSRSVVGLVGGGISCLKLG